MIITSIYNFNTRGERRATKGDREEDRVQLKQLKQLQHLRLVASHTSTVTTCRKIADRHVHSYDTVQDTL